MTADRTWRRAHPRDLPLAAIPFVLVALIPVVSSWRVWTLEGATDPVSSLATAVLRVLPSVTIPLIGAAIVIRHPRAHRTVPLLLFAAILLAIQVAGVRLSVPIAIALTPESTATPPFELYAAIHVGLATIGAFGWAYLGRGLVRARRFEDVGRTGVIVSIAVAITVISTAAQAGAQGFSPGSGIDMALTAAGLLAGFVEKLAIGYVAVTATRGWLAGESRRRGWGLAALGAWLLLTALVVVAALPLLPEDWLTVDDPAWVVRGISLLYAGGGVALLVAFALALPDIDGITWYDLAELDAAAAGGTSHARDPFDDSDPSDEAELFELQDRRLDR